MLMDIFKNKLAKRLAAAKSLGFLVWLIAFCMIPYVFNGADMYIRWAVLLWYTTFGAIIWLMWVLDKHPAIESFKMPWWFRGVFMWAWLNFVLALFIHNILWDIMLWTMFEWYSPFWIVLEWAIIWLIIDGIATKCGGEGKELCK